MTYWNEIAIALDHRVELPEHLRDFLEGPSPQGCRADVYDEGRYHLWHMAAVEWPTDELPAGYNGTIRVSAAAVCFARELLDFLMTLSLHQYAFVRVGEHWGDLEVEGDPIKYGILPTQTMELPFSPRQRLERTA